MTKSRTNKLDPCIYCAGSSRNECVSLALSTCMLCAKGFRCKVFNSGTKRDKIKIAASASAIRDKLFYLRLVPVRVY